MGSGGIRGGRGEDPVTADEPGQVGGWVGGYRSGEGGQEEVIITWQLQKENSVQHKNVVQLCVL